MSLLLLYVVIHIYIYIYTHIDTYIYIYIYTHTYIHILIIVITTTAGSAPAKLGAWPEGVPSLFLAGSSRAVLKKVQFGNVCLPGGLGTH